MAPSDGRGDARVERPMRGLRGGVDVPLLVAEGIGTAARGEGGLPRGDVFSDWVGAAGSGLERPALATTRAEPRPTGAAEDALLRLAVGGAGRRGEMRGDMRAS